MTKVTLLLLSLLFFVKADTTADTAAPSTAAPAVVTPQVITLKKIPTGYSVPVTYSQGATTPGAMLLSLYSSSNIIASNCLGFTPFVCAAPNTCKVHKAAVMDSALTFNVAKAVSAKPTIIINDKWALSQNYWAVMASDCESGWRAPFGSGTDGIIGMGFRNKAVQNFASGVNTFAIYPAVAGQDFQLEFNPTIPTNYKKWAKVKTDNNWIASGLEKIKIGDDKLEYGGLRALFDINTDVIGFPKDSYTFVLQTFKDNYGINCPDNVLTSPVCKFSGKVQKLPNLEVMYNHKSYIKITPGMYATFTSTGDMQLLMKAVGSDLPAENYVAGDYQDTVILGNIVMSSYYTVFDKSDSTVNLYQKQ